MPVSPFRYWPLIVTLWAAPVFAGEPLPDGAVAVFGDDRFRHPFGVNDIAHSPDGKWLAVAGDDWVELWDAKTGRLLKAVRPSGKFRSASANHIAFSPDGKTVVFSTSHDGDSNIFLGEPGREHRVRLWEPATGSLRDLPEQEDTITELTLSPDGTHLLWKATGSWPVLWNLADACELRRFDFGDDRCYSAAFSPDGKRLAFGREETVTIHDVATGRVVKTLPVGERSYSVAFSPDGISLASSDRSGAVLLWRLDSGSREVLARTKSWAKEVEFSPAGDRLAAAYLSDREDTQERKPIPGEVRIWDLNTRQDRRFPVGDLNVHAIDFSPSGDGLVAVTDEIAVRRWKFVGDEVRPQPVNRGRHITCRFFPDGRHLLRFSDDGEGAPDGAAVIESSTGRCLGTFDCRLAAPYYSADSRRPEVVLWDGRFVEIRDAITGESRCRHDLGRQGKYPKFSPDGRLILVPSEAFLESWSLWEVRAGVELSRFDDQQLARDFPSFVISSRTKTVAVALTDLGGREALLGLYDFRGKRMAVLPDALRSGSLGHRMAFTPDGRHIVVVDQNGWGPVGAVVDIHRRKVMTGLRGRPRREPAYMEWTSAVRVSSDGALIATAHDEGHVCLWELRTGGLIREFVAHRGHVTDVDFSPDGTRLVTSGTEGLSIIWDLSERLGRSTDITPAATGTQLSLARLVPFLKGDHPGGSMGGYHTHMRPHPPPRPAVPTVAAADVRP